MTTPERQFVIANTNVFTGEGFTTGNVTVTGSKISEIDLTRQAPLTRPAVADIIDGAGRYLLPGLIDCHVHISSHGESVLKQMAKHGVTTALDMACWPPSNWKPYCSNEPEFESHEKSLGMTDIRSAGACATVPGTMHSKFPGLSEYLISEEIQAADWISARVSEGSHYIKIVADVPIGPSQELLNALVMEAHKAGKLVVAHAARAEAFTMAVRSGADVLTHCPTDKLLDDTTIAELSDMTSSHNTNLKRFSVPTMSIMKAIATMKGPPLDYQRSVKSLAKLHQAGVPILAGTDANKADGPVSVVHGESLHSEFELMLDAGMSEMEILHAATVLPARYFGELIGDRGTIQIGKRADLLLLGGNPLEAISNTKQIERIWLAGVEVDRA